MRAPVLPHRKDPAISIRRPFAVLALLALGIGTAQPAHAADGGAWYVDFAAGHLGRHDPTSAETREWPLAP